MTPWLRRRGEGVSVRFQGGGNWDPGVNLPDSARCPPGRKAPHPQPRRPAPRQKHHLNGGVCYVFFPRRVRVNVRSPCSHPVLNLAPCAWNSARGKQEITKIQFPSPSPAAGGAGQAGLRVVRGGDSCGVQRAAPEWGLPGQGASGVSARAPNPLQSCPHPDSSVPPTTPARRHPEPGLTPAQPTWLSQTTLGSHRPATPAQTPPL